MGDHKILFVDDEPNVLNGIRRSLRNEFVMSMCEGAAAALDVIQSGEPVSVVVSDCRMPEMDGIQLLEKVASLAPDATRVMLTGNTDQETAVSAVNRGEVFRFLNKPCNPDELRHVLKSAIRQYELVTAEKELLEKTLQGSIKVLSDILGLAKPEAFGRTSRLRRKCREVSSKLTGVRRWELDAAALLSQLGCVSIAQDTLRKAQSAQPLTEQERVELVAHPSVGAELIAHIPRMERVAEIILFQNKHLDGSGFPKDERRGDEIPLESRILHAVLAYDELAAREWSDDLIMEELARQPGRFDEQVLAALAGLAESAESKKVIRVKASELKLGMVVMEDVKNKRGATLVCRGQEVTGAIKHHMTKFERSGVLTAPILVAVTVSRANETAGTAATA